MATHRYRIEPRQLDFNRDDPHAGLIRVTDPVGHSFALPFAPDDGRAGTLTLKLGPHALCARQLRALAALLENQQRIRAGSSPRTEFATGRTQPVQRRR